MRQSPVPALQIASRKPQTRAVHGVINFYLHFVEEPPGELRVPPHTAFS
jgi:hypothetical protein